MAGSALSAPDWSYLPRQSLSRGRKKSTRSGRGRKPPCDVDHDQPVMVRTEVRGSAGTHRVYTDTETSVGTIEGALVRFLLVDLLVIGSTGQETGAGSL